MNHLFWHFAVIPENWNTYSKTTDEEPYVQRMLKINGSAEKKWDGGCQRGEKDPLELPIRIHVEAGGPRFPPNPDQFMPKGMPDFVSVPKQHFGTLVHLQKSPGYPESLGLDAYLPQPFFDDLWISLKSPTIEMKNVRVNVFGASLTGSYGFSDVSWQWTADDNDPHLLIADFGIRFEPRAVVSAGTTE